jgi:hypothetical protein
MTQATAAPGAAPLARPRHRLISESEWRRWWQAMPAPGLPAWVRPLPIHGTAHGRPQPDGPERAVPPGADAVTVGLLETVAQATTALELRTCAGRRGLLGVFAVAEAEVVGLRRELLSVDGGTSLRALPGLRLSGLGVDRLVEAVMGLVPPDHEVSGRSAVRLPVARAFALVDAARCDATGLREAAAAELGEGQPLGVLNSLARGLRGTLDVRVSDVAEPGCAFASWLLSDEGWVRVWARGTEVVHVPVSRSAIRARVLAGLTAQLGGRRGGGGG